MLDNLNTMLSDQLNGSGLLIEAERHIIKSDEAKLIRPKFLFACGKLLNVPENKLTKLACAVELIHSASLLHDDIVDQAKTRRLLQSVNSKFGDSIAVLAGDQLLARALLIISDIENPQKSIKATAKALLVMSDAVSLEIYNKDQELINLEQLLSIIDGKTGELFSLCGKLVGFAADNDTVAERLGNIGILLGRIFQMKDDIKDINEDKYSGIKTLPIEFGTKITEKEIDKSYYNAHKLIKSFSNYENFSEFSRTIDDLFM